MCAKMDAIGLNSKSKIGTIIDQQFGVVMSCQLPELLSERQEFCCGQVFFAQLNSLDPTLQCRFN